jgi:NADPH-dependent F420 reductase
MKVAIVGGTGKFGKAFAKRLHASGVETLLGSRDADRARETAAELGVEGGSNEDVARRADLVVLAVKSNAALDTARELAEAIGETPVLCVASDLRFTEYGVLPGRDSYSLAEEVAKILSAPVASGFQSVSAVELNRSEAPDQDVLVCGDDPKTTELALELAGRIVGGRAIDAGPLANSRALEGMTAVMLNVNHRYRAHAGIRITGLP